MTTFTFVHVVLSLVGIFSGFVVVFGLIAAKRLDIWTAVFLASTVATSVTGLLFPFEHFLRDFSLNPTASGCPVMPLDTSRAVPSPSLPAPPLWVRQANGSRSLVLASSTDPSTAPGTAPSCGVSATCTGTSPRTAACG